MANTSKLLLAALAGVLEGGLKKRADEQEKKKQKQAEASQKLKDENLIIGMQGKRLAQSLQQLQIQTEKESLFEAQGDRSFRQRLSAEGLPPGPLAPQGLQGRNPAIQGPTQSGGPIRPIGQVSQGEFGARLNPRDLATRLKGPETKFHNIPQGGTGVFSRGGEVINRVQGTPKPARSPSDLELAMAAEGVTREQLRTDPKAAIRVFKRRQAMKKAGAQSINVNIGKAKPSDIASPRAQLRALSDIESLYKSKFVGKIDDILARGREAVGIGVGTEEAEFRSEVGVFGLETRKFYTGTAQSQQEIAALNKVLPSTGNTETAFLANIAATRRNIQRKLDELITVLQTTTDPAERQRLESLRQLGQRLLGSAGASGVTGSSFGGAASTDVGTTATNPQTGQKARWDGTQWVPVQ